MICLNEEEKSDLLKNREKCLEYLRKHTVDVGLTSSASARSRFLLGIHTRGSPIMRIPPRPVVQPALHRADVREEMAGHLLKACEAAAEGDLPGTAAGMAAGTAGRRGGAADCAWVASRISSSIMRCVVWREWSLLMFRIWLGLPNHRGRCSGAFPCRP